jgi:Zn-dependent protease with chaperone function
MTAVLIFLVLARPEPAGPTGVEQRLLEQFSEAARLSETDVAGAIRLLDAMLDDPQGREMEGRSSSVRLYREQALVYRGQLQLQQGEPQAVVDDMTALLKSKNTTLLARSAGLVTSLAPTANGPLATAIRYHFSPSLARTDLLMALSLRTAAYKALGQHDKAEADRAETVAISREMMRGLPMPYPPEAFSDEWPEEWYRGPRHWYDPRYLLAWVTGPAVVVVAFAGTLPIFFLKGLRQRREGRGSWRRLLVVALALAFLQTMPVLAAYLLLHWRPWLSELSAFPSVAIVVFGAQFGWHLAHLKPVRWVRSRQAPPLLEDPVVLERVAQLSERLGIAPPLTRLVRSSSALQTTQAMVTSFAAPTILLYDGILHRLTPDERDAIIAHELAHLANHTFWLRLITCALCGVATVVVAAFYPPLVAMVFGAALTTGVFLILARRLELDCDRRAARAIGHSRASSALFKIHADQPFQGVTELLIGAIASHPSRDQRLAAIYHDAPADDQPPVEWDARRLLRRRLAAWLAAGLWLSVILACLEWARRWPDSNWPALPMLLLEAVLPLLFWAALGKARQRLRQLQRTSRFSRRRLVWVISLLLLGFIIAESAGLTRPYIERWTAVGIMAGLIALLTLSRVLGGTRSAKLNHKIKIAIQSGDFPAALALCERSPAVVARSSVLRYNHALIRAVLGRREEALIDLEKLRHDDSRFKMSWLALATLYADEGDHARALSLAEELSRDVPGSPAGPVSAAWLLRHVGRLEEAEARAREVLRMEERSGLAHLTLAAVAFDRGDHAAASEELAQAERILPGGTAAALLTAEMALAAGGDDAEAAVREAVRAAQRSPLSFSDKAAARLVERLQSQRPAPPA